MKTETLPSSSIGLKSRIDCGKLTLLQLIERIADSGDPGALEELHGERKIFYDQQKNTIHLAEYLAVLMNSRLAKFCCGGDSQIIEDAYNMTLDKFFNIPARQASIQQQGPQGPNCRYYFNAFVKCAKKKLKENPPANAIEADIISAEILRRLITWHFFLSCKEAKRRAQKLRRRYMYEKDGRKIYLWLSWELGGHCRQWLQTNIPDIDPHRPGEQQRVQAIIDKLLRETKIYYLSELNNVDEKLPPSPYSVPSSIRDQITVKGLAEAVATEKAENINQQRRTIRQLGKAKLKQLIRTVFTQIGNDRYIEKDVACRFGLSLSTLSRFAGSHFHFTLDNDTVTQVPALWRNTAGVLSSHPDFVIAAEKAGVWKQVYHMSHIKNKTRRI